MIGIVVVIEDKINEEFEEVNKKKKVSGGFMGEVWVVILSGLKRMIDRMSKVW